MGIERFDEADDPSQLADAGLPKETGHSREADHSEDAGQSGSAGLSGEVTRSGDVGSGRDQGPNGSLPESPEDTEIERAEVRTRYEYADKVAPRGSPAITDDPSSSKGEEPRQPENEQRHITRLEEARPDDSSNEDPKGADRPPLANDSEGSVELLPNPDDRPADPVETQERDYEATRKGQGEQSADVNETSSPAEDETQGLEKASQDVLERLLKAHAADLATDHTNTTDPDNKQWTAERNRLHGEIVRELYDRAESVPCEHRAIIAGGLPGAGMRCIKDLGQ